MFIIMLFLLFYNILFDYKEKKMKENSIKLIKLLVYIAI